MKYLRYLISFLLFPMSFCLAQFNITYQSHLGEIRDSRTTNNIVCAKRDNAELLYLTPRLITSDSGWSLESIKYINGKDPGAGVVTIANAEGVDHSLEKGHCLNFRVTYSATAPGEYVVNLSLKCIHDKRICDNIYSIQAVVPELTVTSGIPALMWSGDIKLAGLRSLLFFTDDQLLVINENQNEMDVFNITRDGLLFSSTRSLSGSISYDSACHRLDGSIVDNTGTQIRQFTDQGEQLKVLNIPACNGVQVSLSSKFCGERTYWLCQNSLSEIDAVSFLLNTTTIRHYPDIDILPMASDYSGHYADMLVVKNDTTLAIYRFSNGVVTELATTPSEFIRPTGRPGQPTVYGLASAGDALLRLNYSDPYNPEETRQNLTDFSGISDIAVHKDGIVAVVREGMLRTYQESGAGHLSASLMPMSLAWLLATFIYAR